MKKLNIFITVCLILLSSFLVQAASNYDSPEIEITLLSQDPDPVEPSQVVKVKFKVENEGKETTQDVIVKILPKFPFTIYGDQEEKNIGKLRAEQTGADAVIVEYKLKVDENAIEDETEIELMVKVTEDSWISYTNDQFLIDIQTHDAVLDIVSITSDPQQIPPGETAKIDVMVKNLADSLLKDIKFKLDFDDDDLPLAPYQSSSERRVSQLHSDYQKSLTFHLIADPDAAPGLYKIPLDITYNDEKGNAYSVDDVLAVVVGETPQVKAHIKKSTVLQPDKEGKLTLEIANIKTTDVKFLELFILPSEDFQLVSTTDYFYIGDVDSDDTESEEIDIYINKNIKTLHLPIKIKYHDANNKPYQQQFDLEMNLYSSSQLKKFGVIERNYAWLYLLLLIIAVAGYFFYKYYFKKKKQ